MPTATTKRNMLEDFAALQNDLPLIKREAMGQVGPRQYRYADLTAVWQEIQPLLREHNFVYVVSPSQAPEGTTYEVRGYLIHVPTGDKIEGAVPLTGGSSPQQIGAALTYARRYLLACLTGLLTDDDPDAHGTNSEPPAAVQGTVPGDENKELGEARDRAMAHYSNWRRAAVDPNWGWDFQQFAYAYAEWAQGQTVEEATAGDLHRFAEDLAAREVPQS